MLPAVLASRIEKWVIVPQSAVAVGNVTTLSLLRVRSPVPPAPGAVQKGAVVPSR